MNSFSKGRNAFAHLFLNHVAHPRVHVLRLGRGDEVHLSPALGVQSESRVVLQTIARPCHAT